MQISKVNVYDLENSIQASGYPMTIDVEKATVDYVRAEKLGTSDQGSGHSNYLKGICVSFDIKMTHAMLIQFQRYHFAEIVSSQSKMHKLLAFDIKESCHKLVDPRCIELLNSLIESYKKTPTAQNFEKVVYSTPIGMELTMRIATNYMQLLTMFHQREDHKLNEWNDFCNWVTTLPFMNTLITSIKKKKSETLHIKLANCDTSFDEQIEYVGKEIAEFSKVYSQLMTLEDMKGRSLDSLNPIGKNTPKIDHLLDRIRSESIDVARCILKLNNDHLISDIGSLQRLFYSEDKKNEMKGYYKDKSYPTI